MTSQGRSNLFKCVNNENELIVNQNIDLGKKIADGPNDGLVKKSEKTAPKFDLLFYPCVRIDLSFRRAQLASWPGLA